LKLLLFASYITIVCVTMASFHGKFRILFLTLLLVLATASTSSSTSTHTYKYLLWTPQCYTTWFTSYDFFNATCLKSIIARGLSFGIIVGSSVLKLPQMYNFYRAKSTNGVSPTMLYLDVISFTLPLTYNVMMGHPFFTFGEQLIVLSENIVLILMMWYYAPARHVSKMVGVSLVYVALVFGLFQAPTAVWWVYPLFGAAAAVVGRIPQILSNYTNQHTGTLSAFTFVLNSLGGAARMFTTMNTTGDLSIVTSQFVGILTSVIVLVQMWNYRANTRVEQSKREKRTE
jgi:mannose-P-dolichol utilization defect protein 1